MGPALQSVALVAHGSNVYRVGGMLARMSRTKTRYLLVGR